MCTPKHQVVLGGMKEEILMDDNRPLSAVSLQRSADPLQLSHTVHPADPLQLSHPLQPADFLNQQDVGVKSKFVKITNPEVNRENVIVCKDCGKMFANLAKLEEHLHDYHKRARNFKCDWPTCAIGEYSFQQQQKNAHTLEIPGW